MSPTKRTVLITGCSDGGLGAALAIAFHKAGLHVYATARNPTKMASLTALGIETLTLDVQSPTSIASCVAEIASKKGVLDILVNNAGASYSMPFSDLSIPTAKALFDLNVWSYLEVTQAFLPLLLESKGILVNQTSIAGSCTVPFQSTYNASKAAMAMFSDHQRLELAPFGIRVVDLKTGGVKSNFFVNATETQSLPESSLYLPAREAVEKTMSGASMTDASIDSMVWAEGVVGDLLKKNPPANIWRGSNASLARFGTVMPHGIFDGTVKKMTGLDVVEKVIGRKEKSG
jgi:1-acylglycerone phosphate reductase